MINFIKVVTGLILLVAAARQLPLMIKGVHANRMKLLKESKATYWPKALQLENNH